MESEKQTNWRSGQIDDPSENKFTLIWEIENPKYFRHLLNELYSPVVTVDAMERTSWRLLLYRLLPSTRIYATLKREREDRGPVQFDLSYHFDISPVGEAELENKQISNAFRRGESGLGVLLCTDDGTRSCNCFQSQKITIRCVMKNKHGAISRSGQCVARTRLGREDFQFVGRVENFSALKPGGRRNLKTLSTSAGQMIIDLALDEENGDEIQVVITPTFEKSEYMYMFQSSLLNHAGDKVNIRTYNIRSQQKIQKLKIGARKSNLRRNGSEFLSKDILSLFCETTIKTGIESEKVENIEYEAVSVDGLCQKISQSSLNRRTDLEKGVPDRGSSSFPSYNDSKSRSRFSNSGGKRNYFFKDVNEREQMRSAPNRYENSETSETVQETISSFPFGDKSKSRHPFPNSGEKRNNFFRDVNQPMRSAPNRRANSEASKPAQETISSFPFGEDSKLRETFPNWAEGASKQNHNLTFSIKTAVDDFTTFYKKGILCDTKLQTATETFPAHKAILSARSPVFEAMFTSNMKEKSEECIRIDDVDAETMKRFLFFLYSATLERLEWSEAKKLYFAADKYQVLSLKYRCAGILKKNIDLSNCCELLLLADLHQDENLKAVVQNFIARHDKEVLRSDRWRYMEKWHSHLAIATLRAIHMKKT